MKLHNDIYSLDALSLAPLLLGKLICRNINGEIIKARITETESYFGTEDTACHAHKGKTNRTKVLYEAGGIAYVYLCYGIHNLLNVVSGAYDHPEAVLIRGAVIEGSGKNFYEVHKAKNSLNLDGPGKVTKRLQIDRTFNEENLLKSNRLWLEDDGFKYDFSRLKRVGINYATEEYINKLWRFKVK